MQNSEAVDGLADSALHLDRAPSEQHVPQVKQPTYAAAFRCIGPACEDHCCGGWDIPLDKNTFEKYQGFSSEKLRGLVAQFVIVNCPPQPQELYGQIRQTSSDLCPFFEPDRLCGIQNEYGPQLLSSSCSIYPRSLSLVEGSLEGSLSLSCPEAARNVLLIPDFMNRSSNLYSGDFRTDNVYRLAGDDDGTKPDNMFLALRTLFVDMVRDSSRPLWNRLLLIGRVCEILDAGDTKQKALTLLSDIRNGSQLLNIPALQAAIDNLPSNPKLRLEVVFELTDIFIRKEASVRFQDTFLSFVAGISTPTHLRPESDVERFLKAEQNYHSPFFEAFPFILENYLVNYMYKNLFPYGRAGSARFIPQGIFDEYLQMTTQFAWLNALLIGVAGHHRETFAAEHVVKTVQSFTRTLEHYPDLIQSTNNYMSSRRLNDLHGMALLLKS
jgi:lysine-N-methylase